MGFVHVVCSLCCSNLLLAIQNTPSIGPTHPKSLNTVSGSSHTTLTVFPPPSLSLYQHQGHWATLEGNWAGHVQSQRPVYRKSCQWSETKNCSLVLKNTKSSRSSVLSGVTSYSCINWSSVHHTAFSLLKGTTWNSIYWMSSVGSTETCGSATKSSYSPGKAACFMHQK